MRLAYGHPLAQVMYELQAESFVHCVLMGDVGVTESHVAPCARLVLRQVSQASPDVLTPPFTQYSVEHLVLHGPVDPQTHAWMNPT